MEAFARVVRDPHARQFLLRAAEHAASALGVFSTLEADGPLDAEALACRLGLSSHRRLRCLLELLVAARLGLAVDSEHRFTASLPTPALSTSLIPAEGWGALASVISTDLPLETPGLDAQHNYQCALDAAARDTAEALWTLVEPWLPATSSRLLDVGGGLGAYSRAFVARSVDARATLVDLPEVIALFEPFAGVETVASDLLTMTPRASDVVLFSNVLHLHGPARCVELLTRARRSVEPGGRLLIKDFFIEDDRSGPLIASLFALNMTIYTEEGDVHTPRQIDAWLTRSGWRIERRCQPDMLPDCVLWLASPCE